MCVDLKLALSSSDPCLMQKSCASGSSPGEEELSPRSGQEDEMPAETSSLSPSPASQLVAKDREVRIVMAYDSLFRLKLCNPLFPLLVCSGN